jgi:hypothetical protein
MCVWRVLVGNSCCALTEVVVVEEVLHAAAAMVLTVYERVGKAADEPAGNLLACHCSEQAWLLLVLCACSKPLCQSLNIISRP